MRVKEIEHGLTLAAPTEGYLIDREHLAWAAGLFEGEGYFSINSTRGARAIAGLATTDKDVSDRFNFVVGRGTVRVYEPPQPTYKIQYRWTVEGFEDLQFVAALLWPWLGTRRRARIAEVLNTVREYCLAPHPVGQGRGRKRGSRNQKKET